MTDSTPRSLVDAFSVFRSRWDAPILGASYDDVCRFDDYQRALGISRKTLAERLKYLVGVGLLTRERYQDRPPRHTYRLTAKGLDLLAVFDLMSVWASRWNADPC